MKTTTQEPSPDTIQVSDVSCVFKRDADGRFVYVDRKADSSATVYRLDYDDTGLDSENVAVDSSLDDHQRVPARAVRSPGQFLTAYIRARAGLSPDIKRVSTSSLQLGAEYAFNVCHLRPSDQIPYGKREAHFDSTYQDPTDGQFYRASSTDGGIAHDVVRTSDGSTTTVDADTWADATESFERVPSNAVRFPASYLLKYLPFSQVSPSTPRPDTGGIPLGVEYALAHTRVVERTLHRAE
jgi:hypothetical protein